MSVSSSVLTATVAVGMSSALWAQAAVGASSTRAVPVRVDPPQALTEIFAGGAPKSLADLRQMEAHTKKLVTTLLPVTVSCNGGGSGVIVRGGYVLTCAHVTRRAGQTVRVVLQDGTRLVGKSLGLNHRSDAGLVKLQGSPEEIAKLPFAEMGRVADLAKGQWVAVLGENGGRKNWRRSPLRIGRLLRVSTRSNLVTDCTMSGGDSGGPLFDMAGRVIGINSKISASLAGNLHVPIDAFHREWDKLVKGETIGQDPRSRTRTGASSFSAKDLGAVADLEVKDAAKVASVRRGSPAAKAGVRAGDVIVGYKTRSGRLRKMRNGRALSRRLVGFAAGSKVTLVIERDGKKQDIQVTLTAPRSGRRQRRQR